MFGSSYLNHFDMSWYEHMLQSICILQHSPVSVWFYPCSYICKCLKMLKKSQMNEYSDSFNRLHRRKVSCSWKLPYARIRIYSKIWQKSSTPILTQPTQFNKTTQNLLRRHLLEHEQDWENQDLNGTGERNRCAKAPLTTFWRNSSNRIDFRPWRRSAFNKRFLVKRP